MTVLVDDGVAVEDVIVTPPSSTSARVTVAMPDEALESQSVEQLPAFVGALSTWAAAAAAPSSTHSEHHAPTTVLIADTGRLITRLFPPLNLVNPDLEPLSVAITSAVCSGMLACAVWPVDFVRSAATPGRRSLENALLRFDYNRTVQMSADSAPGEDTLPNVYNLTVLASRLHDSAEAVGLPLTADGGDSYVLDEMTVASLGGSVEVAQPTGGDESRLNEMIDALSDTSELEQSLTATFPTLMETPLTRSLVTRVSSNIAVLVYGIDDADELVERVAASVRNDTFIDRVEVELEVPATLAVVAEPAPDEVVVVASSPPPPSPPPSQSPRVPHLQSPPAPPPPSSPSPPSPMLAPMDSPQSPSSKPSPSPPALSLPSPSPLPWPVAPHQPPRQSPGQSSGPSRSPSISPPPPSPSYPAPDAEWSIESIVGRLRGAGMTVYGAVGAILLVGGICCLALCCYRRTDGSCPLFDHRTKVGVARRSCKGSSYLSSPSGSYPAVPHRAAGGDMTRAMALDDHVTSPDSIEYPSDLVSLDVGRSMKQTKPARPPSLHKKPSSLANALQRMGSSTGFSRLERGVDLDERFDLLDTLSDERREED